jgi:crotonobetainyl-CoA:carnitine CoA-transferase CaiB-like acyl-CoA transferase
MSTSTPLSGIRVLEFGGYISLPYATSILCALGAEVVKVERIRLGDDFRRGVGVGSFFFRQYNSGKRSFSVDLKRPEGIDVVKKLIPRFDVVAENMRPGKMDSLGLGRGVCTSLRSDIIFASVTGFGDEGPLAQRPAYDTIGQAYGALLSILSNDGEAQLSGSALADLITGVATTTGIMAALVGRANSEGPHGVETSLMEAVSLLTVDALTHFFDAGHEEPTRQSRHPQAQNFVLKTAAGDDLVVHLSSSPKFWTSFLDVIDRRDLEGDPRFQTFKSRTDNYFDLAKIVVPEFLRKSSEEWQALLTEFDVPFAPVLGVAEFTQHPQVQQLSLLEPETEGLSLLRPPWRFDGERPHRDLHVAAVGEHTREIALEVFDDAEISQLMADEVLFES